jgi:hypothetical protein
MQLLIAGYRGDTGQCIVVAEQLYINLPRAGNPSRIQQKEKELTAKTQRTQTYFESYGANMPRKLSGSGSIGAGSGSAMARR